MLRYNGCWNGIILMGLMKKENFNLIFKSHNSLLMKLFYNVILPGGTNSGNFHGFPF
jgi:hypothetical protein